MPVDFDGDRRAIERRPPEESSESPRRPTVPAGRARRRPGPVLEAS